MAKQDWKVVIVTLVLSAIVLKYFINVKIENQAFEISHRHVKYHANWTSKFQSLRNVNQLQDAYKLNNIQSLDLSFSMSSLPFSDVKKLLPVQFKPYKSIKINLANNPIGTDGADYVLSLIPNGVQELQISFDAIQANDQLGSILTKRLNNLNSLKKLKVSLILAVKDEVVVDDYLRFGRLGRQLESYSLILIGNGLSNKSLGYLETHLSRANLKALDLNFYANKIGAEGAAIIAKAIRTQTNLESLNVDLYFNNITAVGTKDICDSIQSVATEKFKQLGLNLDFNFINNQGGKTVGNLLGKLKSLSKLNLGVASKNFGYNGYKHVVNGIAQLTQLTELTLRAGVNRVGGGGAGITKNLILKLVNLKFLSINFFENYVGDQGVIDIATGVAELQNLEYLTLNFGFNDIKGYGLIKVLELLAKKTYKELYLGFSSNEFQDPQVKLVEDELIKIIKKTKKLQIQFMETAISKQQKLRLQELFRSQNKFNNNKITLHVNSIITDDQKKEYDAGAEKRQAQLKKLMADDKKKGTQKVVEKEVEVQEQQPEETLELDNDKTSTPTSTDEQVKATETGKDNIEL